MVYGDKLAGYSQSLFLQVPTIFFLQTPESYFFQLARQLKMLRSSRICYFSFSWV